MLSIRLCVYTHTITQHTHTQDPSIVQAKRGRNSRAVAGRLHSLPRRLCLSAYFRGYQGTGDFLFFDFSFFFSNNLPQGISTFYPCHFLLPFFFVCVFFHLHVEVSEQREDQSILLFWIFLLFFLSLSR